MRCHQPIDPQGSDNSSKGKKISVDKGELLGWDEGGLRQQVFEPRQWPSPQDDHLGHLPIRARDHTTFRRQVAKRLLFESVQRILRESTQSEAANIEHEPSDSRRSPSVTSCVRANNPIKGGPSAVERPAIASS
jgi:hypothetical protein